jgi:hypothetical protein
VGDAVPAERPALQPVQRVSAVLGFRPKLKLKSGWDSWCRSCSSTDCGVLLLRGGSVLSSVRRLWVVRIGFFVVLAAAKTGGTHAS